MKSGYKIHWTDNALKELSKTIDYLENNFTDKEMFKKTLLFITVLLVYRLAVGQQTCPVIPMPQQVEKADGAFILDEHAAIDVKDSAFVEVAQFFN